MPEQKLHRTHEHFMAVVVSVLWVWHISATTSKCLHTAPLCHLASVTPLYHHVPHGCLYLLPCSFWIMAKPLHHRPWCHLVFKVYIYDFSLPLVRALWCDLWLDICPLAVPLPHPGLRNHWDKWKPVSATVHSNVGPHRGFETVFLIPPPSQERAIIQRGRTEMSCPFPQHQRPRTTHSLSLPKVNKKSLYPDSWGNSLHEFVLIPLLSVYSLCWISLSCSQILSFMVTRTPTQPVVEASLGSLWARWPHLVLANT